MFNKSIFLLIFLYLWNINGVLSNSFRYDYSYNKKADGWFKLHQVPATWKDAQFLCKAEGAVLASPLTNQLREAMVEHVLQSQCSVQTIFTGVHSIYATGVYSSVEGVPLSRMPIRWASGEPDNYQNSESCLVMVTASNGTMGDVKCTDVFPYICYKKRTQSLVFTECGTHDTGEGFSRSEYNLDVRTGSCYKFHRRAVTWPRAYITCIAEGGHLAIMNSELESQVLIELYAKNPDNVIISHIPYHAAIGTYDFGDGGSWLTIHGETPKEAGFEKWNPGEPNNGTQPRGEFCGVTHRANGFLYDAPCDWLLPFICEKAPERLQDF